MPYTSCWADIKEAYLAQPSHKYKTHEKLDSKLKGYRKIVDKDFPDEPLDQRIARAEVCTWSILCDEHKLDSSIYQFPGIDGLMAGVDYFELPSLEQAVQAQASTTAPAPAPDPATATATANEKPESSTPAPDPAKAKKKSWSDEMNDEVAAKSESNEPTATTTPKASTPSSKAALGLASSVFAVKKAGSNFVLAKTPQSMALNVSKTVKTPGEIIDIAPAPKIAQPPKFLTYANLADVSDQEFCDQQAIDLAREIIGVARSFMGEEYDLTIPKKGRWNLKTGAPKFGIVLESKGHMEMVQPYRADLNRRCLPDAFKLCYVKLGKNYGSCGVVWLDWSDPRCAILEDSEVSNALEVASEILLFFSLYDQMRNENGYLTDPITKIYDNWAKGMRNSSDGKALVVKSWPFPALKKKNLDQFKKPARIEAPDTTSEPKPKINSRLPNPLSNEEKEQIKKMPWLVAYVEQQRSLAVRREMRERFQCPSEEKEPPSELFKAVSIFVEDWRNAEDEKAAAKEKAAAEEKLKKEDNKEKKDPKKRGNRFTPFLSSEW